MVDISEKLIEIKRLVDKGEYFIINKARQYGKTTTLKMLRTYLGSSYVILSLDFQSIGAGDFQDEYRFSKVLAEMLLQTVRFHGKMSGYQMEASALDGLQRIALQENEKVGLRGLLMALNQLCENTPKPVVLMVLDGYGLNDKTEGNPVKMSTSKLKPHLPWSSFWLSGQPCHRATFSRIRKTIRDCRNDMRRGFPCYIQKYSGRDHVCYFRNLRPKMKAPVHR